MNILVTTMGASWQILPELIGFTDPGLVDLFQYHPGRLKMEKDRQDWGIVPPDEVWIISSCGRQSEHSIEQMLAWFLSLDPAKKPVLRIWQIAGTDALTTEAECRQMAEGVHTVVCHGADRAGEGCLMLSLAGGRKTMSTDMQQAGAWFGCHAMIHVVDDPDMSRTLKVRDWGIKKFLKPLTGEGAGVFTPFCLGIFPSYPLADRICSADYPLPFSKVAGPVLFHPLENFPLTSKIADMKSNAGFLMSNYTNKMLQGEIVTNFLALYSLPEAAINRLKAMKFDMDPLRETHELSLLKRLPKAELHCHLGGLAAAGELIRIARAAEPDVKKYHKMLDPCLKTWKDLVRSCDPERIRGHIKELKAVRTAVPGVLPALCTAGFILLFQDQPDLLHRVMTGPFSDPEKFCGIAFSDYEKMGDLQGSSLLSHSGCLAEACHILAQKALDHHVDYLEVRCSPVKYALEGQTGVEVCRKISDVFTGYKDRLKVSLILTASRHGKTSQIERHVQLAQQIFSRDGEPGVVPLRGFALAGDEKASRASEMHGFFLPMMKNCMHFTIHAGENYSAESIWEAVYYLSAERIGHGLSLREYPSLMEKILDRDIALEMCSSSNFQIVGFKDNYFPSTRALPLYPLKEYLEKGLTVTVNTDNPGISATDFTQELHRACRLTPGGLSLWEILSLIRNSFKASFAPRPLKYEILKKAEEKILGLLHSILNP